MPETWGRVKDRIRGLISRDATAESSQQFSPDVRAAKELALHGRAPEDQARIEPAWREISKDVMVQPDVAWDEAAFQIHHEENLRDLTLESDAEYDYNPAREPEHFNNSLWIEEEKLILKLREYSSGLGEEVTHAEQLIASHLATEIETELYGPGPSHAIDLSQKYDTADQGAASQRHERAMENLQPLIREAEALGYQVSAGSAIANRLQQSEKIAPLAEAQRSHTHSLGVGMGE